MRNGTGGGALVVRAMQDGTPAWEAKWYDGARQVKRRLGRAWLVADDGSYSGSRRRTRWEGWLRRSGSPQDGYMSEEEAWAALRRAQGLYAAQKARAQDTARMVRFEDAGDAWLRERAAVAGWKATTLRNYSAMLRDEEDAPKVRGRKPRARLMRVFGGKRIESITTADVRAFLRELDRDASIGPRSVNAHRQVLSMIFAYAVEQGWRDDNPVAAVPKRREHDERELIVYSPEQVQAIARKARDEQDAALIVAAAFSGLRLGELLELRRRDVRFAEQSIHVQRSYSAGLGVTTPKGRRGRSVPLAEQVAQVLARLSQRPDGTRPGDLVFARADGGHLDPTAVRRRYVEARNAAALEDGELPALRFHDLRHTFGSLAARQGLDLTWIKATMGHANVKTTMRYLHHRPHADDAARLSRAFGGSSEQVAETATADV
jgi:integrase